MNAGKSGKPREPWERKDEDPEPVHLPFIDVEEQAQWPSLCASSRRGIIP